MRKSMGYRILAFVCVLSLLGCERSLDDVAKWKAQGKTKKLVAALGDNRQGICVASIQALGELKVQSAVAPLAKLVKSTDSQVALAATHSLATIGGDAAEVALVDAIACENRTICVLAIESLGTLHAEVAVDPLIKTLGNMDEKVATAAAVALGKIHDEKAIQPLTDKVQDRSYSLRLACVKSLSKFKGEKTLEGLILATGDLNKNIRQAALLSLEVLGEPAMEAMQASLRSNNPKAQYCAVSFLKNSNAVPTDGSDLVWYKLVFSANNPPTGMDMKTVNEIAQMGLPAVDALLEAVAHDSLYIRELAFRTLEAIGEPALLKALEAVEAHASPVAKQWYANRSKWAGAPAWQNDLWGAAAALDPSFSMVSGHTGNQLIRDVLRVTVANVRREYIPQLIILNTFAVQPKIDLFGADSKISSSDYTPEAVERLKKAGARAVFPLIAALEDGDSKVANSSARVLGSIGDKRAIVPIASVLTRKVAAGEELTLSPFYTVLQKFNDPSTQNILRKVRPNVTAAKQLFAEHYPDYHIVSVRTKNARAGYTKPIGFIISYFKEGKRSGELAVVFKKNSDGDWLPTTPLPSTLP